jgi:hypothetical protein
MRFRLLQIPAVFLLAAVAFAADPISADPSGTWQWTTKGHRGQKMQSTLHLQLQDGQLTGTISSPSGDTPINDATFKGNVLTFSATSGDDNTIRYSGTLSADTIKGTVIFPGRNGGDPVTHNWTAKRVLQTPPPPSS